MNYRLSLTFAADENAEACWFVERIRALAERTAGVEVHAASFEPAPEFEPVVATGAPDLEDESVPTGAGYRS